MKRLDRLISSFSEMELKPLKKAISPLKLFNPLADFTVKPKIWESEIPITKAAFASNGSSFACGFANGVVTVIPDLHEVQVEPSVPITDIAWSKAGDFVVFATEAGDIWKWDFASLELLGEYYIPVTALCLSPDDAYIITGSDDGVIQVRDMKRGILLSEVKENGHTGSISRLNFLTLPPRSKMKQMLFSTSVDGTIRTWNWRALVAVLPPAIGVINAAVGQVTSISYDPTLQLFGVSGEVGVQLIKFKGEDHNYKTRPPAVENRDFFPTVKYGTIKAYRHEFLLAQQDGTLMILKPDSGEMVEFVQGRHFARITSLSSSPDEAYFLTTSVDGLLKIWPAQLVIDNNPKERPAAWDRKAQKVGRRDRQKSMVMVPFILPSHSSAPITCSVTESYQDSTLSLVGRADGTLSTTQSFVLSPNDHEDIDIHLNHFQEGEIKVSDERKINAVAISPQFNLLASAHGDFLQVWVYHSNKRGQKNPDRLKSVKVSSKVTSMQFSPDEKYILVATEGNTLIQLLALTLETVADSQLLNEEEPGSHMTTCAFASSGNFLAVGTSTGFVKVWRCHDNKMDVDFTPGSVWFSKGKLEESAASSSSSVDLRVEGATSMCFTSRDDGEYLAVGTTHGRVFVWQVNAKVLRKIRFTTETYFASVLTELMRTYIEGSDDEIKSVRFVPDGSGFLTSSSEATKFWNFSKKVPKERQLLNPLKFAQSSVGLLLKKKKRVPKKNDEHLLEETVPWYSYSNPQTLSSTFSFSKSFIFVSIFEKDDNDVSIEPISVLPIVFWQKVLMNIPNSEGTTSPILWLAQRKGSINALKRIVNDATTSILYVTNELDQIPYLFSVKCGDHNMMKFTSNDGQLETFKDSLGRNAVFFSIFSFESSKLLFSGSTWYTSIDDFGSPPLHYTILNGREDVVAYVLFEVIPKLSPKEQRAVLESYDAKMRTPLMLLIEKYPVYAKKILDLFGVAKTAHESGSKEAVKQRCSYNAWLVAPYKENPMSQHNRAIPLMVKLQRRELTSHPLVIFVNEEMKWGGYIRVLFFAEFFLQLFIVLILALAMVFSNRRLNLGDFYTYVFTGQGWLGLRIAIIVLALIDLVWRLFVPLRTLIVSRKIDASYRTISYLAFYIALLVILIENISTQTEATASWPLAVIQLLLMLNLITYMPLFPGIGPVILGVANTATPIAYWGSFFVVVFLAFSITLNALANGFSALDYGTIYWTMNTLFLGTFGQGNGMNDITESRDGLAIAVYFLYMIVVPLILFNILIAMVTEAYGEVEQDKYSHWRLYRSNLIGELEDSMPHIIRERFYPSAVEIKIEDFEQQEEEKDKTSEDFVNIIEDLSQKISEQQKIINDLLDRQKEMEKKQLLFLALMTECEEARAELEAEEEAERRAAEGATSATGANQE